MENVCVAVGRSRQGLCALSSCCVLYPLLSSSSSSFSSRPAARFYFTTDDTATASHPSLLLVLPIVGRGIVRARQSSRTRRLVIPDQVRSPDVRGYSSLDHALVLCATHCPLVFGGKRVECQTQTSIGPCPCIRVDIICPTTTHALLTILQSRVAVAVAILLCK